MLLIFVWHVRGHYLPESGLPTDTTAVTILTYFCLFITFHVDLFVLITGYFGVRGRRKPLVKTLLLCVFYSIILNLIALFFGEQFCWEEIIMPISHSPWWFMQVYILLVLLAPVIERYVTNCTNTEFHILLAVMLFIDVYLGFLWQLPNFLGHGYDLINFVTVYLLGIWIRRQEEQTSMIIRNKWAPAAIFILCCLIRYKVQPITAFTWTDYNSPLALIMAVCLFLLCKHIRVPFSMKRPILFLSTSAIAVYLITDYPAFRTIIMPTFVKVYSEYSDNYVQQLISIMAFVSLLYTACCVFDKIRIVTMRPLYAYLLRISKRY